MTPSPSPKARKPARAPSLADLSERDRYARLTAASIDAVRASAQTWRNGLTAFITLVTTGVIIKGASTTTGLTTSWRLVVTILIGGALVLASVGLWQALAAEAGTDPKQQTLHDIRAGYGTLTAYQVHLAAQAARRLQWGRRAVAAAVITLLAGIIASWWAPADPPSSPAHTTIGHEHAMTSEHPTPLPSSCARCPRHYVVVAGSSFRSRP